MANTEPSPVEEQRLAILEQRIDALLDEDPGQAGALLNAQSFDAQMQLVLRQGGVMRQELILLSNQAQQLAEALPAGELYLTVKDIGEDDALPLLALISTSQMQALLDMDVWRKSDLDLHKFEQWLLRFHAAGPERIAAWLRSAEPEDVAFFLSKALTVHIPGEDEDPMEAADRLPAVTLDGVRHLKFRSDGLGRALQEAFVRLHADDADFVRYILDDLFWELPGELEETALRLRESRLAESGLPPVEEAVEIYQYIPPGKQPEGIKPAVSTEGRPFDTAVMPLREARKYGFLHRAIDALDPSARSGLALEFLALTNKVMVAETLGAISPSELRLASQKMLAYINIGLEHAAQHDLEAAAKLLGSTPCQYLFSMGFSRLLDCARAATRTFRQGWAGRAGLTMALVEPEDQQLLEGLTREVDRSRRTVPGTRSEPFRSLAELARGEQAIARAEAAGIWLLHLPDYLPSMWTAWVPSRRFPGHAEDLRASGMVFTALVNFAAGKGLTAAPVSAGTLGAFLRTGLTGAPGQWFVYHDILRAFQTEAAQHWPQLTPTLHEAMDSFWARTLDRATEEISYLTDLERIDVRGFSCIWIDI